MKNRSLPDLLIRADASQTIGAGHVMRTLALAQAWQKRGGDVTFLSCQLPGWLAHRIALEGCCIREIPAPHPDRRDLLKTLHILSESSAPWVVLDGYHLDISYQRALREADCRLLLMDDGIYVSGHEVDILVNQNLGSEQLPYHRDERTTYLLGAQYILLRDDFASGRSRQDAHTAR